jgi:hypothetical protein
MVQMAGHALAQREVDAVGVVDEHADTASPDDLREQHLDIGLAHREAALDLGLKRCH